MNTFGRNLRLSIFGESHGRCVGCTLDGLPAGFLPDWGLIKRELARRSPRRSAESTPRIESDEFEILSGIYNSRLTGAPLTALFFNHDMRHDDYAAPIARPSHADFAAYIKYGGYNDRRGGGMFSGRLTSAIVFAGAIAKQLMAPCGIKVISHILSVGNITDDPFAPVLIGNQIPILDDMFPVINRDIKAEIEALFGVLRTQGDSIGGIVECAVLGLNPGIGEPFFNSLESMISHAIFSIPGVRGIEFGDGFALSKMLGSEANDGFTESGKTFTNHSGGINGGISNGMPLIFRACFKPVPSIAKMQSCFDLTESKPVDTELTGRHDVCIVPRGCVIIEAAAAFAICDLLFERIAEEARNENRN